MTDSRLDDSTASHAILRRSLFFEKSASMTLLEVNGPNARKFHMTEDKMRRVLLGEASQHKENSGSLLRRVHLHRVLLGEGSCNQFPFALGLKLHGIPGMVFDASGQEWSFVMGARQKMRGDTVLFESAGDEKLMQTWEEEFPKWNADNLETVCAMQVCMGFVRCWVCVITYRICNLFWHDKLIILEIFATEINFDELIHLAKHAQFCVKSRIDLYLCH